MFVPSEKARYLENAMMLIKDMANISSDISRLAREQHYEAVNLIKLMKDIQIDEVKSKIEAIKNRTFDRSNHHQSNLESQCYSSRQSLSVEQHQYETRIQQIEFSKTQLMKRADELAHEIRDAWIAIACDS